MIHCNLQPEHLFPMPKTSPRECSPGWGQGSDSIFNKTLSPKISRKSRSHEIDGLNRHVALELDWRSVAAETTVKFQSDRKIMNTNRAALRFCKQDIYVLLYTNRNLTNYEFKFWNKYVDLKHNFLQYQNACNVWLVTWVLIIWNSREC